MTSQVHRSSSVRNAPVARDCIGKPPSWLVSPATDAMAAAAPHPNYAGPLRTALIGSADSTRALSMQTPATDSTRVIEAFFALTR